MNARAGLASITALCARASLALAVAALIALTVVIAWQVFARFVLNASPSWSEPLALLLMVTCVLLGAAVGVREGFHLGLTMISSALPAPLGRASQLLASLLVALFGGLMAINAAALIEYTTSHIIPGLGVTRAVSYLPFALCGTLIVLFAIERAWATLADPPKAAAGGAV
jgi:TRAP-type C4-dicarboxylate transport system permease small subunit